MYNTSLREILLAVRSLVLFRPGLALWKSRAVDFGRKRPPGLEWIFFRDLFAVISLVFFPPGLLCHVYNTSPSQTMTAVISLVLFFLLVWPYASPVLLGTCRTRLFHSAIITYGLLSSWGDPVGVLGCRSGTKRLPAVAGVRLFQTLHAVANIYRFLSPWGGPMRLTGR